MRNMWYACVKCGKKFELSEAEKDFHEEKNLSLPKRCKECRKRNRIEKNEAVVPRGKERRKRRKNALRQVPVTTLILLIALTFVYISFVRKPESSTPKQTKLTQVTENPNSSIQKAVLFQSDEKLKEHYEKHGKAMGFASAEEYLAAANAVILNEEALHKTQKDEDDVYYLEETNDFVVVSPQGYLRTYFRPEDGIKYYRRQ